MYGFEGKPFYLPKFVCDRFIATEVARQKAKRGKFFHGREKTIFLCNLLLSGMFIKDIMHLSLE
jgi:hypothetical protein